MKEDENTEDNNYKLKHPSFEQYIKHEDIDVYQEQLEQVKSQNDNDTLPRTMLIEISPEIYFTYRVKIETIKDNNALYVIQFTDGQKVITKPW